MTTLKAKINGEWVPISTGGSGGGTGTDEVWVGADDPIAANPTIELWVDTDEAATLSNDTRWNTAWGIVGSSAYWDYLVTDQYVDVGATSVSLLAGRRYVMHMTRASSYGDVVGDNIMWRPNVDGIPIGLSGAFYHTIDRAGIAYIPSGTMDVAFTVAASGAKTLAVTIVRTNGTGLNGRERGYFTVEDVGPVSGSTPAIMSPTDRWNTAWGAVLPPTAHSDSPTVGSTPLILRSTDVSLVAGRRYLATIHQCASYAGPPPDTYSAEILVDGVSIGAAAYAVDVNNYYLPPGTFARYFTATTGVHNVAIRVTRGTNGTGVMQARFALSVDDIGPVSGAVAIPDPTPAWLPLTLTGGFTQRSTGYTAAYRKVGDEVQLRGLIDAPTAGTTGAGVFATLPVGYRPDKSVAFPATHNGTGVAINTFVLRATGTVETVAPLTAGGGFYIGLDVIRFSVTP